MTRQLIQIPGITIHAIRRGINRGTVFEDDSDFDFFLVLLEGASNHHDVAVHSYVLMTNHYHLIATPNRENGLSLMLRDVNREYVRRFNRRRERIGTLWTGRPRGIPICDDRHFLTCLRYVEQNPVRAGMVVAAEDYRWSSFRVHAFGEPCDWLVPHVSYLALGSNPGAREDAYRTLSQSALAEADLVRQRHRLWRQAEGAAMPDEYAPRLEVVAT
jgi:putative transposase